MSGGPGRGDDRSERSDATDKPPGSSSAAATAREWWRHLLDVVRAHVRIDARALAALRIGLGGVLLLNLLLRARYLREFYTDAGVFPRAAMVELYPVTEHLSLHGQFGSAEAQAVLFAIAGIAALALLLGYRTTLATVLSLGLLFSLHGRNPLVLNGGDILLRHLLLWGVFLPLGERWSVDATRRTRGARDRVASVATAGLFLQIVAVYATNAVLKHRGSLWTDGTAVRYVFGLDQFTVLLGDALAEVPWLVSAFGRVWFWLLTVSWLLLVLRGWPRAILASAFVGAHVAMALTMQLGVFPLVAIVGLLVFLPAPVWRTIEARLVDPVARSLGVDAPTAAGVEPSRSPIRAPALAWNRLPAGLRSITHRQRFAQLYSTWRGYVVPTVAALVLVVLLVNNVGAVTTADLGPLSATDLTADDPRWSMFAPNPLRTGHWDVLAGNRSDGERVDVRTGERVSFDRPPDLADTYQTARWRKYLSHVGDHSEAAMLRESLAAHYCREYPRDHGASLDSVTIHRFSERVVLDGENPIDRERYGPYACETG